MSYKNSHTATLFHFTKRQNNLMSILSNGLRLSYCEEAISDNASLGIPMISFCDIPLMSCSEHRAKYGSYAIGFDKEAFGELPKTCSIGPVAYFGTTQKGMIELMKELANKKNMSIGWFKRYQMVRGGKTQVNYDECEWRILLLGDDRNSSNWFWDFEDYKAWRNNRKDKFVAETTVQFSPAHIRYIIVGQESNIANVVKRIMKLRTISGAEASVGDKEVLCSRIISFQQLKRDF